MKQMFRLIVVLDKLDIPWTVENPESSALFWLDKWKKYEHGTFDQCMLGLCPPEPELSKTHRVQKKTRLAGTVDNLPSFNKYKCDRSHTHSVAIGSCVVSGVRFNTSKAAGAYPLGFCSSLAGVFVEHLKKRFPLSEHSR